MSRKPDNRQSRVRMKQRLQWALYLSCAALIVAGWAVSRNTKAAAKPRHTSVDGDMIERLTEVRMPDGITSELLSYVGFTVNFNNDMHQPNYVVWELKASEADGDESRKSKFLTDYRVQGCAADADYRRFGFDRGHMAPAGDMKWSAEAMTDCFYFTNISPQDGKLNSGAWNKLEAKCRQWARRDSSLIIVCGPILSDELTQTIGATAIPVPKRFFKVVLAPYANPQRAIGFIMNNGYVEGGMQAAAVPVDEVERITGFDFFSALPDSVENIIEAQCKFSQWTLAQ